MAGDASLAFSQNLVENFIRFKMFQIEQDRLERREKRYSDQLQSNRLFNQQRIGLERGRLELGQEALAFRKTQGQGAATVFSPGQISGTSQTQGVDDVIAEEFSRIPIDKSGRGFFTSAKSETDRIKASDIETAKRNAMSRLGLQHLGVGKNEQFDFFFNRQLDTLRFPESGRNVEIIESPVFPSRAPGDKSTPITTPPKLDDFFRGEFGPEVGESTAFPSGQGDERVEVISPDGKQFTIPRSQIEQALSEGYELIEQ